MHTNQKPQTNVHFYSVLGAAASGDYRFLLVSHGVVGTVSCVAFAGGRVSSFFLFAPPFFFRFEVGVIAPCSRYWGPRAERGMLIFPL